MTPTSKPPLYLDIEVDPDGNLLAVGSALGTEPVRVEPGVAPDIEALLADPEQVVVTHSKFDLRYLRLNHGVAVKARLHDTMVMAWLVNETTPLDLDSLAKRYLDVTMDKRISGNGKLFTKDDGHKVPLGQAPQDQLFAYCERDVDALRQLYGALWILLGREKMRDYFEDTEAEFTQVLLEMECRGIPIDLTRVESLRQRLTAERDALAATLTQGLPTAFNIRSPEQVAQFLGCDVFTLKGRVKKTQELEDSLLLRKLAGDETAPAKPGEFVVEKVGRVYANGTWMVQGLNLLGMRTPLKAVNKDLLIMAPFYGKVPWVSDYLEWKKLDKLIGTYLTVFEEKAEGGRIYGRFNQTGTVTGRLSSSEPNLQNIPARGTLGADIRDCFRGNLVVGDFAQLEPRLMAHFSEDPVLVDVFTNGKDLYQVTADKVSCDRATAKVLVLSMGYGAGADKVWLLLRKAGLAHTLGDARDLLYATRTLYEGYFSWRESEIARARARGFVETLDGRKRRISFYGMGRGWKEAAAGERQSANAIVQGSAADVVRRVMLRVNKLFPKLHLIGQVHDELLFEYDPAEYTPDLPRLQTWVESVANQGLSVPLIFEPHLGQSWHEAKP